MFSAYNKAHSLSNVKKAKKHREEKHKSVNCAYVMLIQMALTFLTLFGIAEPVPKKRISG